MKKIYIKYQEIINYVIVGILTTIVSLGMYYCVTIIFLNPLNPIQLQIANIISWISAVTFAYFANRIIVFRSRNKKILHEILRFYAARIGTLIMDMSIMLVFVSFIGINDIIAKLLGQIIITIMNYILAKLYVFKKI